MKRSEVLTQWDPFVSMSIMFLEFRCLHYQDKTRYKQSRVYLLHELKTVREIFLGSVSSSTDLDLLVISFKIPYHFIIPLKVSLCFISFSRAFNTRDSLFPYQKIKHTGVIYLRGLSSTFLCRRQGLFLHYMGVVDLHNALVVKRLTECMTYVLCLKPIRRPGLQKS